MIGDIYRHTLSQTGGWRFNEQIIQMQKGEQLSAALKRMDEVANLVDIDLSQFSNAEKIDDEKLELKKEEEVVLAEDNSVTQEEE